MPFSSGSFERVYRAGMCQLSMIAIVALLATAGAPSPGLAQSCVSGQEARQLLEQGQAVPFPEAIRRAGISPNQLAGDPQLCQSGGGFVYVVQVLQDGQVTSVSIPAN